MDYLIFHSQLNPYLNEENIRKLNIEQSKEFWEEIIRVVNFNGIILIENVFEETPLMIKELVETINLPNIKINLDVGHAKLGTASTEYWIKELKDHIGYIHLHTNDGKSDQHLLPTEEEVKELLYILDKYDIDCPISLEYKVENLKKDLEMF